MAKTKLGGNQIKDFAIALKHLAKDIKIPEEMLLLNHATHEHDNKAALDVFTNTTKSDKQIDVSEILKVILEVVNARDASLTLEQTINARALKTDMDAVINQIKEFNGNNPTMAATYTALTNAMNNLIEKHSGLITHKDLDSMYQEVVNARGIYATLSDRFNNTTSSGGTVVQSTSDIWRAKRIIKKGEDTITTPNSYSVGTNGLFVYEGPLLLSPGDGNDYLEVDNNTIKLLEPVEDDTEFTFTGVSKGGIYDWCVRIKSIQDQTDFNTMYRYEPGLDQLIIYLDGMLMQINEDYHEINNYSIRMTDPIEQGSVITIMKRR